MTDEEFTIEEQQGLLPLCVSQMAVAEAAADIGEPRVAEDLMTAVTPDSWQ